VSRKPDGDFADGFADPDRAIEMAWSFPDSFLSIQLGRRDAREASRVIRTIVVREKDQRTGNPASFWCRFSRIISCHRVE
jgi:hypothetical protein